MRDRFAIITCLLLLLPSALFGELPEFYTGILDAAAGHEEQNAGLRVFPILLIPMGGSRQSMGTAYTAVTGDLGFIEANPAGSAGYGPLEVALFHREWVAQAAVESVVFAASVGPVGFGSAGKFFYSPFTAYDESGERDGSGYFVEYLGILNTSVFLVSLPRFSFSVGASAKIVGRQVQRSIAQNQSAYAFPLDIGLLARARLADFSRTERQNLSAGVALKDVGQLVAALDAPLPTQIAAGIAYSPLDPLLVSVDFTLPISLYPSRFAAETYSVATGIEADITDFLSIQTGASLQAENLRLAIGGTVRYSGFTVSVAYSVDVIGGVSPLNTMSVMTSFDLEGSGGTER
jgi:hypothetical protein